MKRVAGYILLPWVQLVGGGARGNWKLLYGVVGDCGMRLKEKVEGRRKKRRRRRGREGSIVCMTDTHHTCTHHAHVHTTHMYTQTHTHTHSIPFFSLSS